MRHVKNVIVETAELKSEIHGLETVLAVREPTLPAAQATQAVAHSGTWSVMAAPAAAALVVGIFLGMAIAKRWTGPGRGSPTDASLQGPESRNRDCPSLPIFMSVLG